MLVNFIWNLSKIREFSTGLYAGTLNGSVFTFSRASDLTDVKIDVVLRLESTSLQNDDVTLQHLIA